MMTQIKHIPHDAYVNKYRPNHMFTFDYFQNLIYANVSRLYLSKALKHSILFTYLGKSCMYTIVPKRYWQSRRSTKVSKADEWQEPPLAYGDAAHGQRHLLVD